MWYLVLFYLEWIKREFHPFFFTFSNTFSYNTLTRSILEKVKVERRHLNESNHFSFPGFFSSPLIKALAGSHEGKPCEKRGPSRRRTFIIPFRTANTTRDPEFRIMRFVINEPAIPFPPSPARSVSDRSQEFLENWRPPTRVTAFHAVMRISLAYSL